MRKPPKFLKKYFWDIDFDKLDVEAHPQYVLGRILEYGDEKAIRWMMRRFGNTEENAIRNTQRREVRYG